jgi:hypothetical protein
MNSIGAFAAQSTPRGNRSQIGGASANKKGLPPSFMKMDMTLCIGPFEGFSAVAWSSLRKDEVHDIDPAEEEFNRQEQAFNAKAENEPLFLSPYQGKFVIAYNGEILEHDSDLQSLSTRFFSKNPDIPAIIKKIGDNPPLIIDTPFFD